MAEQDEEVETQPETPATQPAQDSRDFAKMRKRAETAEAEAASLRKQTAKAIAQAAGFDTTKPIADMAIERFCADRTPDDFTVDAFKDFAGEVGLAPVATETESAQPDNAAQLDTLQGAADRIRADTTQPRPQKLAEEIAAAEAAGEWDKAMSLKDQFLMDQVAPKVPA